MQKSLNFIGIDISKTTLDICFLNQNKSESFQIENNETNIGRLFKKYSPTNMRICFENTGKYGWALINVLAELKFTFYQVNPLHLKRSMGLVRGKDDRIDALRIAQFIAKNHHETIPYKNTNQNIKRVQVLVTKRAFLVKQRAQHKTIKKDNYLIKDLNIKELEKQTVKIIKLFDQQIKEIEKLIENIIQQDDLLNKKHNIVTSIPGVGKILSWNMIIKTNGYRNIINPRKFACYAGVAPFPHTSGSSIYKKPRVSHMADKNIKKLLHMAAMRAVQLNNDLKNYYQRKVEQGKNKMLVLNAVRNKIIHRIFAMIKNEKFYDINLHLS